MQVLKRNQTRELTRKISFRKAPFSVYAERVMELCANYFSPMHKEVFRHYWHTSDFSLMPRSYYLSNHEENTLEFYIPTKESVGRLQYYRICIKIVPEIDHVVFETEIRSMKHNHLITPNGMIDSELLIVVGQHLTESLQETGRKWREAGSKRLDPRNPAFIRGRKTYDGYFEMPVISKIPERCLKRILVLMSKFMVKREKKFLEAWNLDELMMPFYDCNVGESIYYIQSIDRLSQINSSMEIMVRCFSRTIKWLNQRIVLNAREVGKQASIFMFNKKKKEILAPLYDLLRNPASTKDERDLIMLTIKQIRKTESCLNR